MRSLVLAGSLGCVMACSHAPSTPAIDRAHLPSELRGLVPGVATEADVAAAFPDARAVRDEAFGGTHRVELSGEPSMQVQSDAGVMEAWVIRLDGDVRIGSMFVQVTRSCRDVAADLADHVRPGPCSPKDRQPGEHPFCATTPDRRYPIDLSCFDPRADGHPGWLSIYVNFAPAHERWYRLAPGTS